MLGPFIMTETSMGDAGGNDVIVVRKRRILYAHLMGIDGSGMLGSGFALEKRAKRVWPFAREA